jgi:hypothetical protein
MNYNDVEKACQEEYDKREARRVAAVNAVNVLVLKPAGMVASLCGHTLKMMVCFALEEVKAVCVRYRAHREDMEALSVLAGGCDMSRIYGNDTSGSSERFRTARKLDTPPSSMRTHHVVGNIQSHRRPVEPHPDHTPPDAPDTGFRFGRLDE